MKRRKVRNLRCWLSRTYDDFPMLTPFRCWLPQSADSPAVLTPKLGFPDIRNIKRMSLGGMTKKFNKLWRNMPSLPVRPEPRSISKILGEPSCTFKFCSDHESKLVSRRSTFSALRSQWQMSKIWWWQEALRGHEKTWLTNWLHS